MARHRGIGFLAAYRNMAFIRFVVTGADSMVREYCGHTGVQYPEDPLVAAAGVYKAIQYCNGIPDSIKAQARQKCLALGFSPYMEEYDD